MASLILNIVGLVFWLILPIVALSALSSALMLQVIHKKNSAGFFKYGVIMLVVAFCFYLVTQVLTNLYPHNLLLKSLMSPVID